MSVTKSVCPIRHELTTAPSVRQNRFILIPIVGICPPIRGWSKEAGLRQRHRRHPLAVNCKAQRTQAAFVAALARIVETLAGGRTARVGRIDGHQVGPPRTAGSSHLQRNWQRRRCGREARDHREDRPGCAVERQEQHRRMAVREGADRKGHRRP
jgi:hypothetical protein